MAASQAQKWEGRGRATPTQEGQKETTKEIERERESERASLTERERERASLTERERERDNESDRDRRAGGQAGSAGRRTKQRRQRWPCCRGRETHPTPSPPPANILQSVCMYISNLALLSVDCSFGVVKTPLLVNHGFA